MGLFMSTPVLCVQLELKAQNLGTRFLLLPRPKTARGILWPALQSTVSLRKLPRRASVIRLRRLQDFKRSSGSDCRIFQLEAGEIYKIYKTR